MKIKYLLLVIPLFAVIISCNTTEPIVKPELTLKLEDVSCTEAWLQLTTNNLQLPAKINLLKNNVQSKVFILNTKDSLLYIDSLIPNQSYKFKIVLNTTNNPQPTTNEVLAQTMDTTSHNFTWQSFEFGQHSSSVLYDVAIIDENNIWAVGEIYMNDSLGNSTRFNAVHWDGSNWELKRILYAGSFWVIRSIFAFNENDIWFSAFVRYYNGNFIELPIPSILMGWGINKLWGSSSNDLYAVGNNGNIAHYNGSSWTKIESGTTTNINDVWGITNQQYKTILYCAVSSFFVPGEKKILKIIDGKVQAVNWNKDVRIYSAWAQNENFLYVCGEGVFVNKYGIWNEIVLQPVGTNSIRGNDINDIFIDGDYGFISHFNGSTWQVFNNSYLKGYARLSFKGNIVAVCGNYQGKALIEIGRRN